MNIKLLKNLLLTICLLTTIDNFAATITVTNKNDNGTGSIRQAIANAVTGDTIIFAVTDTIKLTSGELFVDKKLTIIGPGASILAIDGNGQSRVFHNVKPLTISGLTIQNGNASVGGGIANDDSLTIHHCTITRNYGGGINSEFAIIMKNCEVSHNRTPFNGGGLSATKIVVIDSCTIFNDTAAGSSGGLWFTISSSISISNSTIANCISYTGSGNFDGGGGIYFGTCSGVFVTNCLITGNRADDSDGGGIYNANASDIVINNCIISNNSAHNKGGGIYCWSEGHMRMYNSEICKNTAGPFGGGIILEHSHLIEMDNCKIHDNSAKRAGGIFISIVANITNSAIYNNHATFFYGGGLVADNIIIGILSNNTISGNTATTDGGGIYSHSSNLTLKNNTITNNTANQNGDGLTHVSFGGPSFSNCILNNTRNFYPPNAVATSYGGNISSDTSMNYFLKDSTDINNTNPLLDTLAFNGGFTPTHALKCGSPAINLGKSPISTDQRGFLRIGKTDAGSFEAGTRSKTKHKACDSFKWNGTTCDISGIYKWIGTNSIGCDSLAILDLTVDSCVLCNLGSNLPTKAGTYNSVRSNTYGKFTCYCDENRNLLLTLDTNGSNAIVPSKAVRLQIGNTTTTSWNDAGGLISNPKGGVVLNRKWTVYPTKQPTNPVKVKFYFTKAEYDSIVIKAANLGISINNPNQLQMYLLNSSDFADPHNNNTTGTIWLHSNAPSLSNWVYTANDTNHSAEFMVSNFDDGGGGACSFSLPVPLSNKIIIKKHIAIYPNPTNNELNIELDIVEAETVNVTISDMMGKTVFSSTVYKSKSSLDLSDLSKGVYTISIIQNGVVENYKIVKQ